MAPDINVQDIFRLAPRAVELVRNIRGLFGNNKTGPEKKALALTSLLQLEGLVEDALKKDVVNGPAIIALYNEAIQVAYDADAAVRAAGERIKGIEQKIRDLRGTGAPIQ
jgi:hypothetical protein